MYSISSSHRTALHLATSSGNEECVRMLLNKGAAVNAWDGKRKATPLHCAASKGHHACLKTLLQYGADVNAGLTTRSPLHYAVQSLAIDCVKTLLQAGAIPHSPQVGLVQFINSKNVVNWRSDVNFFEKRVGGVENTDARNLVVFWYLNCSILPTAPNTGAVGRIPWTTLSLGRLKFLETRANAPSNTECSNLLTFWYRLLVYSALLHRLR